MFPGKGQTGAGSGDGADPPDGTGSDRPDRRFCFPVFPKSGTMNNRKQAEKLLAFLDGFQIPYTLVFGNHDCEMGSTCNKEQLAEIFTTGKYAVLPKEDMSTVLRIPLPASGIL